MNQSIHYFNQYGTILAKPNANFTKQFPILCIHREDLQKTLFENMIATNSPNIEVKNGRTIKHFVETDGEIEITDNHGEKYTADLLVGADGIFSEVRKLIRPEQYTNDVIKYCGYTYYRATLSSHQLDPSVAHLDWQGHSFESWGYGKRFGYVPLHSPDVFWFLAIPCDPLSKQGANNQIYTTTGIDEVVKNEILHHVGDWKSPVDIKRLIESTKCDQILRTDIYKVNTLPQWYKGRVVILGDAAHATSPNIAQGAGISIEDAMELAKSITLVNDHQMSISDSLSHYQASRIPRGKTVQRIADTIAFVGQQPAFFGSFRDFFMHWATTLFPGIQNLIFQRVVRFSLGGNWVSPDIRCANLWKRTFKQEEWNSLPNHIQQFRSKRTGDGTGTCSVQYSNSFARLVGSLFGFPKEMENESFYASVEQLPSGDQVWKRNFGKSKVQKTKMQIFRSHEDPFDYRISEIFNGARFVYSSKLSQNGDQLIISYSTDSFYFLGIRFPKFLSPKSEWIEIPVSNAGWTFDGTITLPFIGKIFRYSGVFTTNPN